MNRWRELMNGCRHSLASDSDSDDSDDFEIGIRRAHALQDFAKCRASKKRGWQIRFPSELCIFRGEKVL